MAQKQYKQPFLPMGTVTERFPVAAVCSGEMLSAQETQDIIGSIPLNPLATDDMIKELKHESEPMDCVFAVKYRTSRSGTEYADSAYESIVHTILTSDVFVPCCYGHQAQEAVRYEGRPLMGSVIGVMLDKTVGIVYYRIIPDKGEKAADMRRWLKNKQINAISIWGYPTYQDETKTVVVDYKLLSVDFVPPNTQGQEQAGLAIGQMADMGYNERSNKLYEALRSKYKDFVYVQDFFNEYLIAGYKEQFFKIPYTIQNETIELGAAEKVRRTITYEKEEVSMDLTQVTNDELTAEIARRTKGGLLSAEKVAGEMGVKLEDAESVKALETAKTELGALQKAAGEMGIKLDEALSIAKKAKETEQREAEQKAFGEMVDSVKAEKGLIKDGKPTGEMAVMVDKFCRFELGMSREQVAGEMARVINDADINAMIQAKAGAAPVEVVGQKTGSTAERKVYVI